MDVEQKTVLSGWELRKKQVAEMKKIRRSWQNWHIRILLETARTGCKVGQRTLVWWGGGGLWGVGKGENYVENGPRQKRHKKP